jgi:Tfp pilus assembly PilM family ATPase
MPRIFAIDWDRNEARALVLQSGPTGTSVAGVWSVPLEAGDAPAPSGKQVGAKLAEVMGSDAVGKAITIIGVGRDNVQIKLLSLPPAPDDELPDLVRFQAEREFTALGTEAALDYIPLSGDEQTPHQVLAVALSPAGITEAREVSQAAGVEPDRITVRALATVSLVLRSGAVDPNSVALVVNPLNDEADLAVVDEGKVVLIRTVRLPDAEQLVARQRTLTGEIRRTIAAARQQSADRPIDLVLLCGNASAVDQIAGLGEDLGVTAKMFDPAAHAPGGLTGMRIPPQSLARFSAALGMALSEADRQPPIVDFLNVRRKAEKQRFNRTHAMAVAAALVILLGFGALQWRRYHVVASELTQVRQQIVDEKTNIEKFRSQMNQADAVADWKANDVNWLEVMRKLSEGLRPKPINRDAKANAADPFDVNSDVVVKSLMLTHPSDSKVDGGTVHLAHAVARENTAINALAARVGQDPRFKVTLSNIRSGDTSVPNYPWAFTLTIAVEPRDELAEADAAAGGKSAETPADASTAEKTKAEAQSGDAKSAGAEGKKS